MSNQVFNETQNYRGTWVMYLILMTELPSLVLVTVILFNSKSESQDIIFHLGLVFLIMAAAFFLLMSIQLQTRIDHKGIQYRFKPFLNKWRVIPIDTIKSAEVISYSPISDFGGWGMKGNKTTKAYSILGDEGVLIDFGDKKKVMLGTKKAKDLKAFLENWRED
ncbi:hypothetical protein [Algoriphagus sp. PAP.12]|jgi:hypothetical protein|uniref:hypothetical protein n=1 Tax=Algoriphagus sp. PAP.12 TaxID=2996678 RepID=UPI00227D4E89|nr:hypothetical protein [Algoriphagus sp. PAP.12]